MVEKLGLERQHGRKGEAKEFASINSSGVWSNESVCEVLSSDRTFSKASSIDYCGLLSSRCDLKVERTKEPKEEQKSHLARNSKLCNRYKSVLVIEDTNRKSHIEVMGRVDNDSVQQGSANGNETSSASTIGLCTAG